MYKALHGINDGRQISCKRTNPLAISKQRRICITFFWRKYHFDMEGMPTDLGFHFNAMSQPGVQSARSSYTLAVSQREAPRNVDDILDEDMRSVAVFQGHA